MRCGTSELAARLMRFKEFLISSFESQIKKLEVDHKSRSDSSCLIHT
ncbi:unnamed protein product [Musa textilis]